jgi:hypothetical protein
VGQLPVYAREYAAVTGRITALDRYATAARDWDYEAWQAMLRPTSHRLHDPLCGRVRADVDDFHGTLSGRTRAQDTWQWVESARYRLVRAGALRALSCADLLICAVAAQQGLVILHDDNDFATAAKHLTELRERRVQQIPKESERNPGMLAVRRAGLPPSLLASLKHAASRANPEFFKNENLRISNGNAPRYIRCYAEDLELLYLPRAMVDKARELVAQAGSQLQVDDRRSDPPAIEVAFTATLRDRQPDAVAETARHEHGVLAQPARAGPSWAAR